jgi:DNA polymerase-3 subunit alpha
MCNKYDVPFILTGDSHYAYPEEVKLQDIILAAKNKKDGPAEEEASESFIHAKYLYYQTSEDYYKFNKELGFNYQEDIITKALDNSLALGERINFDFELGKNNFPRFQQSNPIKVQSNLELLKEKAINGLYDKLLLREQKGEVFSDELIDKYKARLAYEFDVLDKKDMVDYFLIVEDMLAWGRANNIAFGPSRGSVGASLVAYAISNILIDPVKHGLLFERFTNLARFCLSKNHLILMKDGSYKKVELVTKEDKVQTETGKGNLVEVFSREVDEEIYYIETEANGILELTGEHIVPIIRDGNRKEIQVKNLLETDLLLTL